MWRDAFGDTYFIKIFLKIVWGCSQDTSHDRNNCCIDIPQFLPFYPELQVLVYLFRAPWGQCFNLLVLPHLSSNSFLPLVNTMSNCLASITLSVLILKPYWSLHLSIHSRASGIYLYVPAGFYIQHCTFYKNPWSFFATVSCLIKNWFFVKLVQATTI